jgi:hypothetical protein
VVVRRARGGAWGRRGGRAACGRRQNRGEAMLTSGPDTVMGGDGLNTIQIQTTSIPSKL